MAKSSNRIMPGPLVGAIDQGTSSTRFLVSEVYAMLRSFQMIVLKPSKYFLVYTYMVLHAFAG